MSETLHSLTVAASLAAGLAILAFLPVPTIILGIASLFALAFFAHYFGIRLFPTAHPALATLFGGTTLLAAQSVAQTAWYYVFPFTSWTGDLVCLAVGILACQLVLLIPVPHTTTEPQETLRPAWRDLIASLAPAAALAIAVSFILFQVSAAATDRSIRTPWPLLPPGTLAAFAIASAATWLIALRSKSRSAVALASGISLLAFTLLVPILYRLGFGFDGFLHRASEQLLLTTGTLTPKPPYYIGQYVFVTWLTRLTGFSLRNIDLLLVPVGAFLLPLAGALAWPAAKRHALAIAALVTLLPLGQFIVTTPQAFAYLIGLLGLILASAAHEDAHPAAAFFLCLWSLAIHPLAGLPFLGGWFALQFRAKNPLSWIAVLLTSATVPAAFYFNSLHSANKVDWHFEKFFQWTTWQNAFSSLSLPTSHIALWPDTGVFAAFLLPILLCLFAGYSLVANRERRGTSGIFLALGIGACLAGLFLKTTGDFGFLIDYERGNYADRLFILAECFWLVPACFGLASLVERAWSSSATVAATTLLLLVTWQGASVYAALPRHDAAVISHGWSVGRADFDAVHFIHQDAGSRAYTVLANQSVSAAAVEAYGFKRYATDPLTHEQVFYYPIPTGGPLYEAYLKAASKTVTRDTLKDAAKLGQSDLVYVVLNDYWWEADQVGQALASSTDMLRSFGNGANTVYKIDFSKATN